MKTSDTMHAKGGVVPSFVNLKDGISLPWPDRHNTLSYDSAKAMAYAFGSNSSMLPNRIGIIYGSSGSGSTFDTITRDQSWSELHDELKTKNCDVQIQPFSCSPTVAEVQSTGSSSEDTSGWGVTFHAHSDSTTEGAFGSAKSSGSSESQIFKSGTYIFQAVLLNKSGDDYTILARVSLANGSGSYNTKPEDFEIALDWTVKFF